MTLASKDMTRQRLALAAVATVLVLASARAGRAATTSAFTLPSPTNAEGVTIVLGPGGSAHAAFRSFDAAAPDAVYAFCASDCGLRTNWTAVGVGEVGPAGGPVRLAVTADGRPRLVWERAPLDEAAETSYEYAECNANCTIRASWTQVRVVSGINTYSVNTAYFALDPRGRPRFLYDDSVGGGTFYASCDANCTVAANWDKAQISTTRLYRFSLVFDAQSRPRMAYKFNDMVSVTSTMSYATCDADCGSGENWAEAPLLLVGAEGGFSLRLDSSGRPRIAVYQGAVGDADPSGNNQLSYLWCDADCGSDANWAGVNVGFPDLHGANGLDMVLDGNDRPRLAYYVEANPFGLAYARCSANCESTSAAWQTEWIETNADLNLSNPVPVESGCSLQSWFVGEQPSLALKETGEPVFGYDARHVQAGFCKAHDDIKLVRYATLMGVAPASPLISIDDRTVAEGSNAGFRVVLSAPSAQPVSVSYSTADASAAAGIDYTATAGTVTLSPGRTTHSIIVPVLADTLGEGAETFFVNLSAAVGASLGHRQGVGTVTDMPNAAKIAMYRTYNRSTDYHFFTTSAASKNFAVTVLGFQDESNPIPFYVWNARQTDSVPLFRLYNPNLGRHFYTAGVPDRDFLMSIGMVYENDEGFIYLTAAPGTTELFKLYNQNSGTHLFTADAAQKSYILANFPVWVQHASVGYVFGAP